MPVNNIIQGTASGVVLDVDTTVVGNIGGGEDDLIVSTIPANTLDVDHKYIHFSASGRFATSINNKQLRAYFGSTKIFDSGSLAITSVSDWILEGWVIRISATTEHALVKFECSSNVLSAYATYSTPNEDLTNQVILKCTGAGTSDNDITQTDLIVDVNNGGTGLGDVSGPSSSIDGHFASFNGSTGKVIRDGTQPTTIANDLLWSAKGQLAVGVGSATGTVLSLGTSGQVLSAATGTSTGLQWISPSGGGGLTLLEQYSASSSSALEFTTSISPSYDDYLFEIINLVPGTTNVALLVRLGITGSYNINSVYRYLGRYDGFSDTITSISSAGDSAFHLANSISTTANLSVNGHFHLFNPAATTHKYAESRILSMAIGNSYWWTLAHYYYSTQTVDRVKFYFASGNIASGIIRCYGFAK